MNPAFVGTANALPSCRRRKFFLSGQVLSKGFWGMMFFLLSIFILAGAPGLHHIIMLDTSGSMSWPLNKNAPPRLDLQKRIDAVRVPFKKHIDDLPIGDTLHLYEFNEGLLNPKTITLVKDDDRDTAKMWVDNIKITFENVIDPKTGERVQKGKGTALYSSLDRVLEIAGVLLEKHSQSPTLLIISDGEDTEEGGQFKDMAAVLKKHDATFEELPSKIFCAIVKFNLGPIREAFGERGGAVVDSPEDLVDPEKNPFLAIHIDAKFITGLQDGEAFIGQTVVFTNQTQTNPPNKLSHLKPDKLQYEWDFGDGSDKRKGPNAKHFYRKPGPYTVSLKAINPENTANTRTEKIELIIKPIVPKIQVGKKNAQWRHPHINGKFFHETKNMKPILFQRQLV